MKKPDIIVVLALVVALGSTITGIAAENQPHPSQQIAESSIR